MSETETYFDVDGNELTDYDLHERFDDMLDEVYGDVVLGGTEYNHSTTFKAVDPIAYRCGFSDWLDSELEETIFEEDPTLEADEDEDSEPVYTDGDEVRIVVGERCGQVGVIETYAFGRFGVRMECDLKLLGYGSDEFEPVEADSQSPFQVVAIIVVEV
jgi:hypothetical protein